MVHAVVVALLLFQAADPITEGLKALDEARYEAAAQAFQKAVQADPKDYYSHFNLALAYGFLHRDAEGVTEYRKTLDLKPGLYEAELNAGILLLRQQNPAEALPLLAAAAEGKPGEFRPRYFLADAEFSTGATPKAEADYRRALELNPKSAEAELGLARALARQGSLADAAPHFRQAAQLDASLRDGLLELAGLYEKNAQTEEAIAILREFPDSPAARERLGDLLLANKQYADAIASLQSTYDKDPTQANRLALAVAFVNVRQFDKALPLLKQAVATEPANWDVHMLAARALRDTRQFPAAAGEFYAALKLKPADAKVWNELGGMLYMMADFPQSYAAFEKARELGEDSPGNCFFRAIILDKLRQLKPALEAYRKFLTMSQGKNPDQEFQARQRSRILQRELEKR